MLDKNNLTYIYTISLLYCRYFHNVIQDKYYRQHFTGTSKIDHRLFVEIGKWESLENHAGFGDFLLHIQNRVKEMGRKNYL